VPELVATIDRVRRLVAKLRDLPELPNCREDDAYRALWSRATEGARGVEAIIQPPPGDVEVSVAGGSQGGKSTLLNALVGSVVLPADTLPTTANVTRVRYRPESYSVTVRARV